jgi:transcriptional regulator with XRE-family HTH domain
MLGMVSGVRRHREQARQVDVGSALAVHPRAFSELLQEMRLRAGLTIPELAARMDVEANALHQYFYRKRGVGGTSTIRWFLRFAEACGCGVTVTFPVSERAGRKAVMRYGSEADEAGSG